MGQLDRLRAAGASEVFDVVVVAGAGLVGAYLCELAAPCAKAVVVLDDDVVTAQTTILPSYSRRTMGRPKAEVAAAHLRARFNHLTVNTCVGVNADVRRVGEGFWRALSHRGETILFSALDNAESVEYVCRMARRAGVPAVAAQVGSNGAQVLAFPAGPSNACYACLNLAGPSMPCLGRRTESGPTISTPAIGAASASLAIHTARLLLTGAVTESSDFRLGFDADGVHLTTAAIRRSPGCSGHEPAKERFARRTSLTTGHTWRDVADAVGDPDAVLVSETLPPITTEGSEASVPLERLGMPLWPVLEYRSSGASGLLELAGDAGRMGLTHWLGGENR